MTDRLTPKIDEYRRALRDRVRIDNGEPLPASFDEAEFARSLDNTLSEHFTYQTAQAQGHAMGLLSHEEAQVVYMALGEAPGADGWAAGTDTATKVVVTALMAELVARTYAR